MRNTVNLSLLLHHHDILLLHVLLVFPPPPLLLLRSFILFPFFVMFSDTASSTSSSSSSFCSSFTLMHVSVMLSFYSNYGKMSEPSGAMNQADFPNVRSLSWRHACTICVLIIRKASTTHRVGISLDTLSTPHYNLSLHYYCTTLFTTVSVLIYVLHTSL
jgi:hypothetical protein